MRTLLVTDTAPPQVNGVVIRLTMLVQELPHLGHAVRMITPVMFRTMPCPAYPEIRLALGPYRGVRTAILEARPDALRTASEGPLRMAARNSASFLSVMPPIPGTTTGSIGMKNTSDRSAKNGLHQRF